MGPWEPVVIKWLVFQAVHVISLEELLTTLAKVYNILQVVHLFKNDQLQFQLT
jgi:hypothetical protein